MKKGVIFVVMAGMASKITVKSVVVICIFIQMLALMPHHHHGGSHLPCVNLFHCTGESAGHAHDDGCGNHEAEHYNRQTGGHCDDDGCTTDNHETENHSHDAGNGDCSFEHKDVIRPARDENRLTVVFIADFPLCGMPSIGDSHISGRSRHESMISLLDNKRYLGASPLHTDYITQAIPPRAPSFTA